MSLDLDTRQRAMLHEMGVHVWLPNAINTIAAIPVDIREKAQDHVSSSELSGRVTVELIAPVNVASGGAPDIAEMNWPQLKATLATCQVCAMCAGRRAPVMAAPDVDTPCDWLVLADPPTDEEERAGLPFVEASGQLLDNMLRAVGVSRWHGKASVDAGAQTPVAAERAYLTHVLKCRPALARAPTFDELTLCSHYLRREIALTQPKVILAMGRFAMHLLLSETPPDQAKQPLGKLRGQVWRFAGVPVVVTYPPVYLLRSSQDKGKAWADLCLALEVAQGRLPVQD